LYLFASDLLDDFKGFITSMSSRMSITELPPGHAKTGQKKNNLRPAKLGKERVLI
jgi:hypothetical protein